MNPGGRPKGQPKTGGRVAGTPNRVTFDLIATMRERGFDPAVALLEVHQEAMMHYDRVEAIRKRVEKTEDEKGYVYNHDIAVTQDTYLKRAESAAAQLMQYTHPKRKAIEHSVDPTKPGAGFAQVVLYVPDNGRAKKG